MAIKWGNEVGSSSGKFKLGIQFYQSPATVTSSTSSVEVMAYIYLWTQYNTSDSNNSFRTVQGNFPDFSQSVNIDTSSGQTELLKVVSRTFTPSRTDATASHLRVALSGLEFPGTEYTAYVYAEHWTARRPYSIPDPVTDLTSTRNSDTSNTLSWTNHPTEVGAYEKVIVDRGVNGGVYVQIASLAGTATSYKDTTTSANNNYRYRVRSWNADAGYSLMALSNFTYNTPAAPTGLSAVKTGTNAVALTWSNPGNTETATEVQRSADGGTTWAAVTTTGADATSYTDTGAPGGTVIYRARNTRYALASAWSAVSNSVATITPPAAPTITSKPDSVVSTADTSAAFSWLHNSLDGSAQTAAQVEVTAGTTNTYTLATQSSYVINVDALPSGQVVTYRVRTKGLDDSYGPWSALETFTMAAPPQVTIVNPATDEAVIETLPVVVDWDYTDAVGYSIAAWDLSLYLGDQLVHTASGDTVETHTLDDSTYLLLNETAYRLELEVRSGSGLVTTATRLFTVDYLPPALPTLDYTVDADTCSVQLTAHVGTEAGVPDTERLSISRIEADGSILVIDDDAGQDTVVVDRLPLLNQVTTYRASAHAANGAVASTDVPVDVQVGPWFVWSFGDAFENVARIKANPQWSHDHKTEQELYAFAGRTYPVLFTGRALNESIELSGTVRDDIQRAQLEALATWGRRVMYRDPHGKRFPVRVSVSYSEGGGPRKTAYSVKMDRVS